MLERSQGLSAITGLVHGFTTRLGGVSEGGFESLNLGARWGDDPARVRENLRRVGAAAGFDAAHLCVVRQVHGRGVLRATAVDPDSRADALWRHRDDGPGVVGVLTADCVPVLLADEAGTVVAAVHSGWRGTAANIVGATVDTLVATGVPAPQLRAAVGPCIERDAFEVGPEVAEQFEPAHVHDGGWPRPHVDLVDAVRDQLLAAGLAREHVERVGGCTHDNPGRYFSYRRDGAGIGQHLSFIGLA